MTDLPSNLSEGYRREHGRTALDHALASYHSGEGTNEGTTVGALVSIAESLKIIAGPGDDRLIGSPAWVLARYEEAKGIINDVRERARVGELDIPEGSDLWDEIEDFHNATFLDRCTTLGPDCGCNGSAT